MDGKDNPPGHVDKELKETEIKVNGTNWTVGYHEIGFGEMEELLYAGPQNVKKVYVLAMKKMCVTVDGNPIDWENLHPILGAKMFNFTVQLLERGPSKN